MLDYIESYDAIDTCNLLFDQDGWSSSHSTPVIAGGPFPYTTRKGLERQAYLFTCDVTITVFFLDSNVASDTHIHIVRHSDIGTGTADDFSAQAFDTAIKGSVSDGMKRCLRKFGNQFGNSLYGDSFGNVRNHQDDPPQRPPIRLNPVRPTDVPY